MKAALAALAALIIMSTIQYARTASAHHRHREDTTHAR